jgi:DNA-binding NarL/FixJ family response regulator
MARISCLAGIDERQVAQFHEILVAAGAPGEVTEARLNVAELGKLEPNVLICDVDAVDVDKLETLRRLRFVLPQCVIVLYTASSDRRWAVACHLAGANGILCKASTDAQLVRGVRGTIGNGCFTDPRFAAA